ncbi:hypothetical protein [Anabaena sp. CCY 9402-a]|uniref:hypothetical protein n=1 Tax=Anabaena sp. CCY 9402-a TaxID=3103867 RepID=UPI0039C6A00F
MNLHLHKMISDITGLTGMVMIKAIVVGAQDPQVLASLKNPRIKSSATEIAKALTGDYSLEHGQKVLLVARSKALRLVKL